MVSQDELGYHGSHYGVARKMISYASYDFETWTQASCLGFRRDEVAPRPEVLDHNVAEEAHQGAMLWHRGNVVVGGYDMWLGNPMGEQDRSEIDLGLVVTNDGLHYREPIPDFKLIQANGEPGAPSGSSEGGDGEGGGGREEREGERQQDPRPQTHHRRETKGK